MEKIIEQAELIIQYARAQALALEGKDRIIQNLKTEIAQLKLRPVAPVEPPLKAWVSGEMVAPGVLKWALHLSEPQAQDIVVNIAHTDTKTNELTPFKWTVPKGKTMVSGTYGYKGIKRATYQVEPGEGYATGKTAEQLAALTIVWELDEII